jgi:hypothetical protein
MYGREDQHRSGPEGPRGLKPTIYLGDVENKPAVSRLVGKTADPTQAVSIFQNVQASGVRLKAHSVTARRKRLR